MSSFAAIDFETATASRDSACAVGLAIVENGEITIQESRLIQSPGNVYDGINMSIHGMSPHHTKHAPGFSKVWPEIAELIGDRLVVAHNTAFDTSVLRHSAAGTNHTPPATRFVCSYRLAKTTWPE